MHWNFIDFWQVKTEINIKIRNRRHKVYFFEVYVIVYVTKSQQLSKYKWKKVGKKGDKRKIEKYRNFK